MSLLLYYTRKMLYINKIGRILYIKKKLFMMSLCVIKYYRKECRGVRVKLFITCIYIGKTSPADYKYISIATFYGALLYIYYI